MNDSEEAPTEESLEPGPDGKLISTEERMQIIQQQQVPETTPEKTAAVEGTESFHQAIDPQYMCIPSSLGVHVVRKVYLKLLYSMLSERKQAPVVNKFSLIRVSFKFFFFN